MATNRNFSEEYRGPSGWFSAIKSASFWGGLASIVPFAKVGRDIQKNPPPLTMTLDEAIVFNKKITTSFGKWSLLTVVPVMAVSGFLGYRKAANAQSDHEAAVATVKDLTVENAKLKADSAYQSRFAEREQSRRSEVAEHASSIIR